MGKSNGRGKWNGENDDMKTIFPFAFLVVQCVCVVKFLSLQSNLRSQKLRRLNTAYLIIHIISVVNDNVVIFIIKTCMVYEFTDRR